MTYLLFKPKEIYRKDVTLADWFDWLLKEGISFCIRVKNNVITTNARGLEINIDGLFYDLKPSEQRILSEKRKLWKQRVYLSALRLANGELLIVAMDKLIDNPIELYSKRWEIETLFFCLKTRGLTLRTLTLPIQIVLKKYWYC